MSIDKNTILKTARLANLSLNENEINEFTTQLSDILNYVEKINQLDTSNIIATDHIENIKNVFRKDDTKESIQFSEIEKMAPEFDQGHFIVPKIIN